MPDSFKDEATGRENLFCSERRGPRREPGGRYFVTFRKPGLSPEFVEVTVVAKDVKSARIRALEIVRPIKGLVGSEVD